MREILLNIKKYNTNFIRIKVTILRTDEIFIYLGLLFSYIRACY